ncbi:unnamed protein product [Symbiodinium natans]|uniref:Uncharacterized protein n=1 Tax=Symbiodinium natans TaxID=878477 RepID=A0A812P6V7_9DINO|nr:unnamed protein product [Symbiodinium natans]
MKHSRFKTEPTYMACVRWAAWHGCEVEGALQMTRQRRIETYAEGDGEPCDAPLTETAGCADRDSLQWYPGLSYSQLRCGASSCKSLRLSPPRNLADGRWEVQPGPPDSTPQEAQERTEGSLRKVTPEECLFPGAKGDRGSESETGLPEANDGGGDWGPC